MHLQRKIISYSYPLFFLYSKKSKASILSSHIIVSAIFEWSRNVSGWCLFYSKLFCHQFTFCTWIFGLRLKMTCSADIHRPIFSLSDVSTQSTDQPVSSHPYNLYVSDDSPLMNFYFLGLAFFQTFYASLHIVHLTFFMRIHFSSLSHNTYIWGSASWIYPIYFQTVLDTGHSTSC
jgi:hypothetical protein